MYERALKALEKSHRLRDRDPYGCIYTDLASNDYLGLAQNKKSLKKVYRLLDKLPYHSPKASQLVNGYHPIHQEFERTLAFKNGFEDGMVVGSGFLANIALLESLARRGDTLILDEKYHASGILASKLSAARVVFFKHNDANDLLKQLQRVKKRAVVAVEGVYSMDGDIVNKEIFALADRFDALLVVDEAHSSGVLGKNLLGVFDHYEITPQPNHIKMGTLGKAYGSYGAYILASAQIVKYLENRAKAVIYTTAPSLFDIALAYFNFHTIIKKRKKLRKKVQKRLEFFKSQSLIIAYETKTAQNAVKLQQELKDKGFLVGAIRPPTVQKPMLRVIPNLGVSMDDIKKVVKIIDDKKDI